MSEHNTSDDQPRDDDPRVRTRRRTRTRSTADSGDGSPGQRAEQGGAEGTGASPPAAGDEPARGGGETAADAGDERSRARAHDGSDGDGGGEAAAEGEAVRVRRRSRGSRGRRSQSTRSAAGGRQGAGGGSARAGEEAPSEQRSQRDGGTRAKDARKQGDGGGGQRRTAQQPPGGQRRQPAASRGGSSRRSGGRRARGRGRRTGGAGPSGGVSEETRRAITEGPPRRMLVSVGDSRTQIAVLEERDLVEHYVTRKQDTSYVGNVYLGRVQNVLPGMEAAFIDIGKGRNGVLYAGEVNYDEADLDGEAPRIEQTLKPGQTVLVQVTKDPMGTKGARLTQNLSIAGRYCVLAPGEGMLGISRKLTDDERARLRGILKDIKPDGFGLIVRTAAEGATAEQLSADVERLVAKWEQVSKKAEKAKPLAAVYEEPDLVIRVIRDIFGPEYSELIVDSEDLARQVKEYLADVSPEHVDKVSVYQGDEPIFDAYEITTQIRRALEKKVWLKSGGYLIIEKTEAMWVIDVNTGRFVGKSNLEETVLRNNLEAADEIARQLRLRDMGGIIVIDFVDMMVPANRDEVLKRFRRELARDKTKSRVMEISKLGLVQMTRKNVSQGLTESFTVTCDCCDGRGAKIIDLG